jgi:chemotaxis protein methyltransferase CheR
MTVLMILMDRMDDRTFREFASLIYAHSGIFLGRTKKELVRARVAKRMRKLGLSDYRDYYLYVIKDLSKRELAFLLDVISTNVTSFFREMDHFDFISSVIKSWYAKGQRRFRLWSAGCSTGEEPFSLAITIFEALRKKSSEIFPS